MVIKNIIDEDFSNYKTCSMFIGFPYCTFKCEKECGIKMCQNSSLAAAPSIDIKVDDIVSRYMNNPLSHAIVCGGLEPMDSWVELLELVACVRKICDDDIVIYTGYNVNEIKSVVDLLSHYKNIVVKFGRYIPNQKSHLDTVLGINLASDNQYAVRIS